MRIVRSFCLMLGFALALSGNAFAQASKDWRPEFRHEQHIYVGPDAPDVPLSPGLDVELNDIAGRGENAIDVYVVVANGEARSGGPLSADIFDKWSERGGFSQNRSLVITITGPAGRAPISAGVRAGYDLNKIGINRDLMNSQSGPVWAIKPYLNEHPELIPAKITRSIVTLIENAGGLPFSKELADPVSPVDEQARTPAADDSGSSVSPLAVVAVVVLLGGFFWVMFMSPGAQQHRAEKRRLQAEREAELKRLAAERAAEAARKKLEEAQAFWAKVQAISLDSTADSADANALLCARLGIDTLTASELIEEYKRFVFLCVHFKLYASPSKLVDEVWHLHMTEDTEAYYGTMCGGVLGTIFFHDPFKGQEDQKKGPALYKATLDAYREFFGMEPNPKYWPNS